MPLNIPSNITIFTLSIWQPLYGLNIKLLDLHLNILSKSESQILIDQIEQIQKSLTLIPINGDSKVIIAAILSEQDELYQKEIKKRHASKFVQLSQSHLLIDLHVRYVHMWIFIAISPFGSCFFLEWNFRFLVRSPRLVSGVCWL